MLKTVESHVKDFKISRHVENHVENFKVCQKSLGHDRYVTLSINFET